MDKKTLAICKKYAKELSEASGGNSFQLVVNGEGNAVVQIEKTETQLIVTKGTLDIEEKPEIWLGTKAELEALTTEEKESYVLFITTDEDGEIIDFNVEETGTGNVISSIVVENNVLKVNKITALTEHPATDIKPTTIGSETLGFGDTKEVVTDIKTDEFGHVTERSSCNITLPTETELSIEVTGEGNTVDNVSVEGHKITVNKVNRTEQNVNVTETGTGNVVTGVMATGHDVTVVRGNVELDGKVKADAESDSKYLSEIVDNDSIQLEGGYLVAKSLQGLNVGVAELNFIQGLSYNLVSKLDTLTNPLNFLGVYNTYAELEAVADVVNGNVAIVVQDENNNSKQMTYIYSDTWEAVSENTIELRDFSTEPINLESETTGILPINKVDTSTLAKLVDIAGFLTEETPITINVTGTGSYITGISASDHTVTVTKGDVALSLTETGEGNGVASVEVDGTEVRVTKDTFLTAETPLETEVSGDGNVITSITNEAHKVIAEKNIKALEQRTDMSTGTEGEFVQYIGETTDDYTKGRFYQRVDSAWQEVSMIDAEVPVEDQKDYAEQVAEMPTPSEELVDKIIQYVGVTTEDYQNGLFYKCIQIDETTYGWEATNLVKVNTVASSFQFDVLPKASADLRGKIYQYIGKSNYSYTSGHFYICLEYGASGYTWYDVITDIYQNKNNGYKKFLYSDKTLAGTSNFQMDIVKTNIYRNSNVVCNDRSSNTAKNSSIATGCYTVAEGRYSQAHGYGTRAMSEYQIVFGKLNIEDTENKYIEIVGKGTETFKNSPSKYINGTNETVSYQYAMRSNARTLDWSGNEVLAGTCTAKEFVYSDGAKAVKGVTVTTSGSGNVVTGISRSISSDGKITLNVTKGSVSSSGSPSVSIGTATGSGNAITSLSISNNVITPNKGKTFSLSNHTHDNYLTNDSIQGLAPTLVTKTVEEGTTVWDITHNKGTTYGEAYGYPLVMVINQSTGSEEKFDVVYTSMDSIQIKGIDSLEIGTQYNIILR